MRTGRAKNPASLFSIALILGLGAGLGFGCAASSTSDDECSGTATCSDHGSCDDSSGAVVCTCDPGYAGERCDECAAGFVAAGGGLCEPSSPCDDVTCSGHSTCDDSTGTAVCTCDPGYTGAACDECAADYMDYGDGECRPIDPCTTDPTCADQNRICAADEGVAVCGDCLDGFHEAGGVCVVACAAESNPGQLVPLDLYVMLDRSASMTVDAKWDAVTLALQTFVAAPEAVGIGVGLQYFPLNPTSPIPSGCASDPDCGIYGPCLPMQGGTCVGELAPDTSCDPADYDDAEVGIATLPGVQQTILSSLSAHAAEGAATPSEPAMQGAVSYATTWAQANPSHLVYIVFATDGEPTGCLTNTIAGTAALAQSAAAGNPSVKTFVIGVGAELTSLNQIAAAGGTGQAYLVDTGGNVTQQFIDALNQVRAIGDCLFQIPQPEIGNPDYNLINVSLVDPSDPSNSITVVNVGSEAGCDPVTGGWYYDDPPPRHAGDDPALRRDLRSGQPGPARGRDPRRLRDHRGLGTPPASSRASFLIPVSRWGYSLSRALTSAGSPRILFAGR